MAARLFLRWLVVAATILALPYLLPGVHVVDLRAALVASLMLGVLNVVVRPLLVLLTFPVTLLTLGLFLFVINALLFQWTSSSVAGIYVDGFGWAFLAALLISLVNVLMPAPNRAAVVGIGVASR